MSNLIERDALLVVPHVRKVVEHDESGEFITFNAVSVEDIEKAPAVDAVEVVRCADCENYTRSPWKHPTIGWCKLAGSHRRPDYYCADGRKK